MPSFPGLNYMTIGYKGNNAYDSGLFYCPYVPLQKVRAVDPDSFQPKIGFKTRYGMVANPFAQGSTISNQGSILKDSNVYYRRSLILNLM
jgi:Major capsid protein Gp23